MMLQFILNGLVAGLLYSLLAIGFALVYNTTHIFHIAAAGIYVFAAYMFWWLAAFMPWWCAGLCSIILSMGLSWMIDATIYLPLKRKNASNNIALVSSIGAMTIIINTLSLFWGNETKSLSVSLSQTLEFGPFSLSEPQMIQFVCSTAVLLAFIPYYSKSPIGLRIRALSENETLFSSLGYNRKRLRAVVFLLSGCFISIASCLNAIEVGMDVNMGMNVLITAIVAMIVGGTGNVKACLVGGVAIGILQSLILIGFSSSWQNAITFIVLLLFLFFRPQGIAGYKQRTV